MFGVEISIAGASDSNADGGGKNPRKNVAYAPGVIIRRNHDHATPFFLHGKLHQGLRFFSGGIRIVREGFDLAFWHTPLTQIVHHEFRDPRKRTQSPSARYDFRRHAPPKEFRGTRCPVGIKIIVAQNNNRVRTLELIFYDPTFSNKS